MKAPNRYARIIEHIFGEKHAKGITQFEFSREDLRRVAKRLRIELPKNLGDLIYSLRYRESLPESIQQTAPSGQTWIIVPAGRSQYRFETTTVATIVPAAMLAETKIPDATPGIIAKYALSDEQALLAKLRYNRLIDVFTGVTCYSLQSHLRTSVVGLGQVETDEVYIGVDRRGAHYAFPVQAKGGRDRLSIVQIKQDFAVCQHKFKSLICRPLAAQFMRDEVIALFEFEQTESGIAVCAERHYRLVPPEKLTEDELRTYSQRPA